jgi:hypothetical protein
LVEKKGRGLDVAKWRNDAIDFWRRNYILETNYFQGIMPKFFSDVPQNKIGKV